MLDLLDFLPGGKPKYYQYGQAFVEVAGKRGGDARIVDDVVKASEELMNCQGKTGKQEGRWDEALVHDKEPYVRDLDCRVNTACQYHMGSSPPRGTRWHG